MTGGLKAKLSAAVLLTVVTLHVWLLDVCMGKLKDNFVELISPACL